MNLKSKLTGNISYLSLQEPDFDWELWICPFLSENNKLMKHSEFKDMFYSVEYRPILPLDVFADMVCLEA